jgi:endonuclease/exonuclease/phosphatase family metal-dependent hydrolase
MSQAVRLKHKAERKARLKRRAFYCLLLAAHCLLITFSACAQKRARPRRAVAAVQADAQLLEVGRAAKLNAPAANAPQEFKIVSYNMRWRGGAELRAIVKLLREDEEVGGAAIVGLQEVDRGRERSGKVNAARLIADELGMYYAWAAPPRAEGDADTEDETGVAILSAYPLADVERLVLPHAGPGGRRRVALGATVELDKTRLLRVYCVHAETRISVEQKIAQQRAVIDALAARTSIKRAVVLGDFNTWEPASVSETEKLFTGAGFSTPFAQDKPTWKTLFLELKLDWLWLRDLEPTSHGITRRIEFSDHWPLWVKVKV